MKSRNLRYLTGEGIRNIGTNRLMSLASIAVLMSCLVLIGSAFLIFLNVDSLLENIEDQNVIMVFVDLDADSNTVSSVRDAIVSTENIANCEYVSKESAYQTVVDSLGENSSLIQDADSSFLPDGFKVTVENMHNFAQTVAALKSIENVSSVRENTDLANKLENVRNAVTYICVGIIGILFIVALFIIANTVRITMFTRRLEISIMKAVGATNWFVRWPFLIEGISIGVISAGISIGVLWLMYFFVSDALLAVFGILGNGLVSFSEYGLWIFVAYLAIGVITGGIGSIISIGRYLKEQGAIVISDDK